MPTVDRKGIGGGIVPPFPSQVEKIVVISHREFFFKTKDYGFDIDKTTVPLGTIQDILRLREQVSVHCPSEELHSERGVEGQEPGEGMVADFEDIRRPWSSPH